MLPVLLAQALHSQVDLHAAYGGVVPELASRDHIRRVLPLLRQVLAEAETALDEIDVVAYTRGPGLAGALLVGAGVACSLAAALGPAGGRRPPPRRPSAVAVPLGRPAGVSLSSRCSSPAATPSCCRVTDVGRYALLGDTIDDAAGEAFDKSAKLLGLGYPGGPALARLAEFGDPERLRAAAAAAAPRRRSTSRSPG